MHKQKTLSGDVIEIIPHYSTYAFVKLTYHLDDWVILKTSRRFRPENETTLSNFGIEVK